MSTASVSLRRWRSHDQRGLVPDPASTLQRPRMHPVPRLHRVDQALLPR